jgi:hypothetical protein
MCLVGGWGGLGQSKPAPIGVWMERRVGLAPKKNISLRCGLEPTPKIRRYFGRSGPIRVRSRQHLPSPSLFSPPLCNPLVTSARHGPRWRPSASLLLAGGGARPAGGRAGGGARHGHKERRRWSSRRGSSSPDLERPGGASTLEEGAAATWSSPRPVAELAQHGSAELTQVDSGARPGGWLQPPCAGARRSPSSHRQ